MADLFLEFQAAIDEVRKTKAAYDDIVGKVAAKRVAYDDSVMKARELQAKMQTELSVLMPADSGRVRGG